MTVYSRYRCWIAGAAFALLSFATATAQQIAPVVDSSNPPNTPQQQRKHYVVLVSLDGFRYDYPQKWGATNILAIGRQGASTPDGMLPSYPSLTFPNHYTIVTGLYPEHHGLVNNSFLDPARNYDEYVSKNSAKNGDGSWYNGTPLWSLAEQQGMRAASFFWPGSEAKIAGERPSDYVHFDDNFDDEKRIDQVIAWLKLPKSERPHFITLYYSNTDHAGHDFGPDSTQARDAVQHVDALMGELKRKLDALHLPIDLIITADHETGGMALTAGDMKNGTVEAKFVTNGHTGVMVPVFAFGPGAEGFSGIYPNTEIYKKMMQALGLSR